MKLAREVYDATGCFPKHELIGLAGQMRRAAVCVPSNIAEGKGRATDRDYANFLFHARGSLLELETQVMLARDLGYIADGVAVALLQLTAAVGSSLTGLINSLRAAPGSRTRPSAGGAWPQAGSDQ
jgi:four helix bundle protein